jgi:putative NADPH-quinone reductase
MRIPRLHHEKERAAFAITKNTNKKFVPMTQYGLIEPHLIQLLYLILSKCTNFRIVKKLIFLMPKRASPEEIQRWRNAYWLLRKKYSNAEIAKTRRASPKIPAQTLSNTFGAYFQK